MSARKRHKERGVVLLTTLLVMSIMATVAVAIMDDVRFGLRRAVGMQEQAQADWYALAAKDFAQSYLSDTLADVEPEALNAALITGEPNLLPIDGGVISLNLEDGSSCLTLGSVLEGTGPLQFKTLLGTLGWDYISVENTTAAIIDWQDTDSQMESNGAEDYTYLGLTPPYRAANTAFTSVMELRAIAGMNEEKYQALRPYVCARAGQSQININTLTLAGAPLLASQLGDNQLELARQIIIERPAGGYGDEEILRASPLLAGRSDDEALDFSAIIYAPSIIRVEADVAYFKARRFIAMEFALSEGSVNTVSVSLSKDARRPAARLTEEDKKNE